MKQVLRAGALGRLRGIRWRGRQEGGLEWGTHVTPWLIHVNVWQKPLQYCKVISLQLIKINERKKKKETCMLVKKQKLEPDIEQQTGSRLRKEYVKAVYCHPAYLTYMQSTSCETLGWMKHKLESRLPGEISITSDMQMIPPLWQNMKNN